MERRLRALEEACRLRKPLLLESFDKFPFDWNVDVAFITRGSQKFADSRASSLTVIASKFIHIHADEFTSEFRVHIARVGKRMAQRLVSMRQAVIDAFANNFTEIVPDCQRDIFAHH